MEHIERSKEETELLNISKEFLAKECAKQGITMNQYEHELRHGLPSQVERNMLKLSQERIKAASDKFLPQRHVEGLGQLVARIDPKIYMRWKQAEGPKFWKQKGELKRFLKDNPQCSIKGVTI